MDREFRILVISSLHSVEQGVGAHRWNGLSKYLSQLATVELLAPFREDKKSVSSHYSEVHWYTTRYPRYLYESEENTFFLKIVYRLTVFLTDKFLITNPFDRSFLDKRAIHTELHRLFTRKKYDFIFVSGPPFLLCYYTQIKTVEFNLPLWVDFRDPWTWDGRYGINLLSVKSRERMMAFEKELIAKANFISAPSKKMIDYLRDNNHELDPKLVHLPHGYDEDDYLGLKWQKGSGKTIKFVYGGTLYDGVVSNIIQWDEYMLKSGLDFRFDIYASNFKSAKRGLENISSRVSVHPPVPKVELLKVICESDFYLCFYPERFKDYLSTKFVEVFRIGIPVILVCETGDISCEISSSELGIHVEPEHLDKVNWGELVESKNPRTKISDIKGMSFSHLANRILGILN